MWRMSAVRRKRRSKSNRQRSAGTMSGICDQLDIIRQFLKSVSGSSCGIEEVLLIKLKCRVAAIIECRVGAQQAFQDMFRDCEPIGFASIIIAGGEIRIDTHSSCTRSGLLLGIV